MNSLIEQLRNCKNEHELEEFLNQNINEVYDFFSNSNFIGLSVFRSDIERYITQNIRKLVALNFENEYNFIFISLLLDICERFEFQMPFQRLYNLLKSKEYNFGERIEAASLYLIGIRTIEDYIKIIDNFLNKLSIANSLEEDTEYKVIHTFINYYAQVVHNFSNDNLRKVSEIRSIIIEKSKIENFSFLRNEVVITVLNIDVSDNIIAFQNIQNILDSYLKQFWKLLIYSESANLIEQDTEYSSILNDVENSFIQIRQISVDKHRIERDLLVFNSLQRGVKILNEEKQLYAYMHSFGKMHYEKLVTSFKYLPSEFYDNSINIIDWGCGQAMATMVYLEYLREKEINQNIKLIKLIEPSEIALKRGALHVKKFEKNAKLITINKDLDSLIGKDLVTNNKHHNLHLFSNIIDIELFSLSQLLENIENNFKGINYFICVSPYITDIKTRRLDVFKKHFNKYETVNFAEINNKSGEWDNNGNWTRVVRIFKAAIV